MTDRTPRRGRGTARQAELFDQLLALILAEGFAEFTLDGLAAKLHCSKTTLYALAGSKEQLVRATVVRFFREATERVESRLDALTDPTARIEAYLIAVAAELKPASREFFDDVAAFPPAREVYERNTTLAAARVEQLIAAGVESGDFRAVRTAFVADIISSAMARIQQRQVAHTTGLSDAEAYTELAVLLVSGISIDTRR